MIFPYSNTASKMQGFCLFLIVLCLLVFPFGLANAEAASDIKVNINERPLSMDVAPFIIEGRTLVPMRAIFEALGAEVGWDGEIRKVTGEKDDTVVILHIDNDVALINGETTYLDVPATIFDGRTMVPLRFIAESLGADVGWDEGTRTVSVNTYNGTSDKINLVPETTDKLSAGEIHSLASPAVTHIEKYDQYGNIIGSGSGFNVKSSGKIVTNYHVIENASMVKVLFTDGRSFKGSLLSNYCNYKDIAIINIDANNLPVVEMGDSDSINAGDRVVAIGSPLGLTDTISDGLISNKERTIERYKYIQTTVPVSPGNSGGPILNERAEVIGVVTWGITDAQNLNFAIPVNEIKPYLTENLNVSLPNLFRNEALQPPSGVWANAMSSSDIIIKWNQLSNVDYYKIYEGDNHDGPFFELIADASGENRFHWHPDGIKIYNIQSGVTKYFIVTAVKDGVESDHSSVASATTHEQKMSIHELRSYVTNEYSYNYIGGHTVKFDIVVEYYQQDPSPNSAFISFNVTGDSMDTWNYVCINYPHLVINWMESSLDSIHKQYGGQNFNGGVWDYWYYVNKKYNLN